MSVSIVRDITMKHATHFVFPHDNVSFLFFHRRTLSTKRPNDDGAFWKCSALDVIVRRLVAEEIEFEWIRTISPFYFWCGAHASCLLFYFLFEMDAWRSAEFADKFSSVIINFCVFLSRACVPVTLPRSRTVAHSSLANVSVEWRTIVLAKTHQHFLSLHIPHRNRPFRHGHSYMKNNIILTRARKRRGDKEFNYASRESLMKFIKKLQKWKLPS